MKPNASHTVVAYLKAVHAGTVPLETPADVTADCARPATAADDAKFVEFKKEVFASIEKVIAGFVSGGRTHTMACKVVAETLASIAIHSIHGSRLCLGLEMMKQHWGEIAVPAWDKYVDDVAEVDAIVAEARAAKGRTH